MESSESLSNEFILIAGTSGMLLLAFSITLFVYLYQRKLIKRKLAYQEIEDLLQQQELKSAYALLEGQDIERKRIAEELHDNLGSILVSLNMYLDTAIQSEDASKRDQMMARIKEIALKASDETRGLSHKLSSVSLTHFGLKTALEDLLNVINETNAIETSSNMYFNGEIKNDISHNIYRIVQELINNTLKHAKASKIFLEISDVKGEYVSIIYQDNGIGFDPVTAESGVGLINIKSRIDKFSGELNIDSNKNGSTFIIEIPL